MELKDIKKPIFYSMIEVAKSMGISYFTLYRMVKSGKIKVTNIAKSGTRPIFALRAEDVQEYYDNLQNTGNTSKTKHK